MSDGEFLARLYDPPDMRSTDHRFRNAAQDIYQHTARGDDRERDRVFYDERFNLLRGHTSEFPRFLCETIHLALALQHERMADARTAALCAEGTWAVFARHVSPSQVGARAGAAA